MYCNNCNINFQTQYAYINDDKYISISEYIKNKDNLVNKKLYCIKQHELICVNGKKNKHHFRHKNQNDLDFNNPMTEWHCEWQSNFPITEIEFNKICKNQIKNRRADIVLNDDTIIEIQHSIILQDEVENRINDYKLHNKNIIWIIDGNKGIQINELKYSERVYLEFISENWKFESFINCDYIYINITDKIYKVCPKLIKSNMIDVQLHVNKEYFINCLKNKIKMFDNSEPLQCKLYIKQQGAGNGKTYGIIKMLEDDTFLHYTSFIYVSKQHSAVHVIYNEFKSQIELGNLKYLKLEDTPKCINKKYVIKYTNLKSNEICNIIIGTVDSFMYAIGNKTHNELNRFEGIINSIIDDYIETITSSGTIKYAGISPKLCKNTILIKDEEQDLTIPYAKAIIQIMRNRYIDVYIVGDKLQSISHENNAFTYLLTNEFPYINKTVYTFTNICRRFNHPKLINFVNSMIPFNKYNLPEINSYGGTYDINLEPIIIFEGEIVYNKQKDENHINKEIDIIMKYYEEEVKNFKRKPEDFLIVTPFTQSNPLVDALQLSINIFWKEKYEQEKYEQEDHYKRYAVFHKSEDGSSIDLTESIYSTRIVSIHSSKGDGRNVVFVIGLNEGGLNLFSGTCDSLIFNSLFHVAITRMKEKLYIRYVNNGDYISNKIQQWIHFDGFETNIQPSVMIYNNIKYRDIINNSKLNDNYQFFYENIFSHLKLEKLKNDENNKKIIDTSHHNIRYASILINLFLQIIKNENNENDVNTKKQLRAILHGIKNKGITETNTWKGYNILLKDKFIPILKLSDKGRDYKKYFETLIKFSNNIKTKIETIIRGTNIDILCPMESIILFYMIETSNNGEYTNIHISELYNIIDVYNKSFNNKKILHTNCLCNTYFNNNELSLNDSYNLDNYIYTHFEKIHKIMKQYDDFCEKYKSVSWLINQQLYFNGKTDDFEIKQQFKLIGYNDECVFIVYIKPQFNELNYNQVLTNALYDSFIVKNIKKPLDNDIEHIKKYKKFHNKEVICIIFSTELDNPYYIDWKNKEHYNILNTQLNIILHTINNDIITKYEIENKMVYNFYKYWRKHCNKKNPLDIITYIISIVEEQNHKRKMPMYIREFFDNIKFRIENNSNKKDKIYILKEYDNKDVFLNSLNQRMVPFISRYFGIDTNVYDNDDDDNNDIAFVSDNEE
jgi:competence CoiA-like predicted nuclease